MLNAVAANHGQLLVVTVVLLANFICWYSLQRISIMVRLTTDLLLRCASSYVKKQRDESRKHYLRRLTHLHLEDRSIEEVGEELIICQNLIVLYLYDNALHGVPSLEQNMNLTHLYLQNNNIVKLENLSSLTRLTKLYVGGNSIVVVEGLEELCQLQELHIENQMLPSGEKLLFDPRSLQAVASTLLVLNISGNGVTSLTDLESLRRLTQLMVTDNKLDDVRQMADLLSSSWRSLQRLDVANNPLCRSSKYRDKLITVSNSLELLDGVEVTDTARKFLHNWQANKEAVKHRRESANLSADNYGRGDEFVSHATVPSAYVMPALNHRAFQKVLARSRSQQSARNSTNTDHDHLEDSRKPTGYAGASSGEQMFRHLSLLNIGSAHVVNGSGVHNM